MRRLATLSDGSSLIAVGGVRVRVGDAESGDTAAAQPVVAAITAAARAGTDGRWWFRLEDGTWLVGTDPMGTLAHVDLRPAPDGGVLLSPPNAEPGAPAPEALGRRALAEARRAFPYARLAETGSLLLANGVVAFVEGGSILHVRPGGDEGPVFTLMAETPFTGPLADGACRLEPWGARLLAACPEALSPSARAAGLATPWRPWRIDGRGGVQRIGDRAAVRPWVVGRDGETLTTRGECPESSPGTSREAGLRDGATRACTWDADRGWHEWSYDGEARVLDRHGQFALLSVRHEETVNVVVYDVDNARAQSVLLSDPAAEVQRAGFTPDGDLAVLARLGTGASMRSAAGVGPADAPIVLRSLRIEGTDLAFSDRRRGMVIGRHAGEVMVTEDAAAHWESARVPVDGDLARVTFPDDPSPAPPDGVERNGSRIQCNVFACVAGRRVVHRWGEPVSGIVAVR